MKIFTKEVKIALMAIVAAALVFFLINFLKGVNIFKSSNTYYVKFDNIAGLAISNAVYANGYPVGTVRTIEYDYAGNSCVVVGIDLEENVRIPRGTRAELETSLMGGVTMNLILGKNVADNIAKNDTILGGMYQGAMAQAANMLPQVQQMLPKMDSIMGNIARLTADPALLKVVSNAAVLSSHLASLSANLDKMSGSDLPALATKLHQIADNLSAVSADAAKMDLEGTSKRLNGSLTQVEQLTTQLNGTAAQLTTKLNSRDNSLGLLLNDRGLYDNLNHTAASADSLLMDFKARPKRYVHFSVFGRKDK